jgi:hypoxanthine phosphoribosyltransferase
METPKEDYQSECLYSAARIAERIQELGRQISEDYAGRQLLIVGVLKGAWVFMADLVRQVTIPIRCDFVRVTSYGMGTISSGEPELLLSVAQPIDGWDVLIVDDILDTGYSSKWLATHLRDKGASRVRLCVLLDKPAGRRMDIQADYVGFEIPDRFVVGYGLDSGERWRELPFVGVVTSSGTTGGAFARSETEVDELGLLPPRSET